MVKFFGRFFSLICSLIEGSVVASARQMSSQMVLKFCFVLRYDGTMRLTKVSRSEQSHREVATQSHGPMKSRIVMHMGSRVAEKPSEASSLYRA
jgi:hypothetical protein